MSQTAKPVLRSPKFSIRDNVTVVITDVFEELSEKQLAAIRKYCGHRARIEGIQLIDDEFYYFVKVSIEDSEENLSEEDEDIIDTLPSEKTVMLPESSLEITHEDDDLEEDEDEDDDDDEGDDNEGDEEDGAYPYEEIPDKPILIGNGVKLKDSSIATAHMPDSQKELQNDYGNVRAFVVSEDAEYYLLRLEYSLAVYPAFKSGTSSAIIYQLAEMFPDVRFVHVKKTDVVAIRGRLFPDYGKFTSDSNELLEKLGNKRIETEFDLEEYYASCKNDTTNTTTILPRLQGKKYDAEDGDGVNPAAVGLLFVVIAAFVAAMYYPWG